MIVLKWKLPEEMEKKVLKTFALSLSFFFFQTAALLCLRVAPGGCMREFYKAWGRAARPTFPTAASIGQHQLWDLRMQLSSGCMTRKLWLSGEMHEKRTPTRFVPGDSRLYFRTFAFLFLGIFCKQQTAGGLSPPAQILRWLCDILPPSDLSFVYILTTCIATCEDPRCPLIVLLQELRCARRMRTKTLTSMLISHFFSFY